MAGSINQTESKSKPFRLMLRVMKAIQSKMGEERSRGAALEKGETTKKKGMA